MIYLTKTGISKPAYDWQLMPFKGKRIALTDL